MQYMLIHVVDQDLGRTDAEVAEDLSLLAAWLDEAIVLQVDLHGSRLYGPGDATTVRSRGGDIVVTDGPFAETKEQVAGYDVLDCASIEDAVQWAARHPTARIGAIEVRPLRGNAPPRRLPPPREGMARYMLLVCVDEGVQLPPEEAARIGPATEAWVAEMDARGTRLFGSQLEAVRAARTVRVTDGRVLVTDGPFAETKEQIAGFDVIECADLDEAIEVASKHLVTSFGTIEVRPFWPFPEG